jgi:hypothetical protein
MQGFRLAPLISSRPGAFLLGCYDDLGFAPRLASASTALEV